MGTNNVYAMGSMIEAFERKAGLNSYGYEKFTCYG